MTRAAGLVVDVRAVRGAGAHAALVRRTARAALHHLGVAPCELSIALVDDREMRALNRTWRGKDATTDVLAFAQSEGEGAATPGLLGDVVVSTATAARQARRRGEALDGELGTLVVHGILHLLGYDHERSPAEARQMFRKQREVIAAIGRDRHAARKTRPLRPGAARGAISAEGRERARKRESSPEKAKPKPRARLNRPAARR